MLTAQDAARLTSRYAPDPPPDLGRTRDIEVQIALERQLQEVVYPAAREGQTSALLDFPPGRVEAAARLAHSLGYETVTHHFQRFGASQAQPTGALEVSWPGQPAPADSRKPPLPPGPPRVRTHHESLWEWVRRLGRGQAHSTPSQEGRSRDRTGARGFF